MSGPLKRACTYVRMSTEKQEDSPERQLLQVNSYCQRKGYAVVRRYADEGERGWDRNRPSLNQMIADARRGLFDVIVVDEMSRLSRQDMMEFAYFVGYPLREANVEVDSVAEGPAEWENMVGQLLGVIRQDKAKSESSSLSRRVLTGYQKLAAKGQISLGRAPYGYRRDRDANGVVRYVLGPEEEVRAVRWIFDAYANRDLSYADIVRELNRRAVTPPAGGHGWCRPTIAAILKSEVYTGSYVFNRRHYGKYHRMTADGPEKSKRDKMKVRRNGADNAPRSVANDRKDWVVIPNTHEPVVDPELFNRVQGIIRNNTRRTTPVQCRGDFLLSGMLVCGECGRPMCGGRAAPTQKVRERYMCTGRMNIQSGCKLNIVREPEVLDKVLKTLKHTFLNPKVVARLKTQAREMVKRSGAVDRVAVLQAEVAELAKKVAKAKKNLAILDEDLVPDVVAQIRAWETRKAEVESDLVESGQPTYVEDVNALVESIQGMLWEFEEIFKAGDRDRQRALLRAFVAKVVVRVEPVPYGKKFKYKLVGGSVTLKPGPLSRMLTAASLDPPGDGPNADRCWNLDSAGSNTRQVQTEWVCLLATPEVVVEQDN
jgi:site-specific DNA recombinase